MTMALPSEYPHPSLQVQYGCLDYVDDETISLILQCQIDDLEHISNMSKGKAREGEKPDHAIAIDLYKEELMSQMRVMYDRKMTQSIAKAVQSDGQLLHDNFITEEREVLDRTLAYRMSGVDNPSLDTTNQLGGFGLVDQVVMDDELLDKLAAIYVCGTEQNYPGRTHDDERTEDEQEQEEAESSSFAMGRPFRHDRRRCEACGEDKRFFEVARAPCQHEYCGECLDELFRASMNDQSLFPPRCCKLPIQFDAVRIFLSSSLAAEFKKKIPELETPNRTYCWAPQCSAFINPIWIVDEVASCSVCQQETCTICKNESHQGDCPNDEALQQLLETAQGQGWQRCYKCWRIVELDHGCNHMTCFCNAQFCYICGERWKTCNCEQWDEHRLLARATQIHEREPIRGNQAPAQEAIELALPTPEAILVAPIPNIDPVAEVNEVVTENTQAVVNDTDSAIGRIMQNLRDNHACDHRNYNYVRGSHQCEECYYTLPRYIFECRQCQLRVCNRCRRNRL